VTNLLIRQQEGAVGRDAVILVEGRVRPQGRIDAVDGHDDRLGAQRAHAEAVEDRGLQREVRELDLAEESTSASQINPLVEESTPSLSHKSSAQLSA
jgi:hypothetical protein